MSTVVVSDAMSEVYRFMAVENLRMLASCGIGPTRQNVRMRCEYPKKLQIYALYLCFCSRQVSWLGGQDVGLWPADLPSNVSDLWLPGDHFVGKLAAYCASSAFHPPGVGKY